MLKIQNRYMIGQTPLRQAAFSIAEAGLKAIDTSEVTRSLVSITGENSVVVGGVPWHPGKDNKGKIYLVGVGKCASEAAAVIESLLGDRLDSGVVLDVFDRGIISRKLRFLSGTHPLPSTKNVLAAAQIVEFLKRVKEGDLVIFVISGGGSTLLCLPFEDTKKGKPVISCAEESMIMSRLISVGATICEINKVRKHLSLVRGGQLAKHAYPAKVVSLIYSDVPGNELSLVASGPTVLDESTVKEAKEILQKYEIFEECETPGCGLMETPKDEKYFENVTNLLAVSNLKALSAMHSEAEHLGFHVRIVTDRIEGEAREVGQSIMEELDRMPHNSVLLYGGETTVTLEKDGAALSGQRKGRGGRNGELALSALRFVNESTLLMSVASDGLDNGPYAGAIADGFGKGKAEGLGLSIGKYLANHDSNTFFEKTGDYLMCGATGSNVSDLIIGIKG